MKTWMKLCLYSMIALAMVGCSSKKKVVSTPTEPTSVTGQNAEEATARYQAAVGREFDFDFLQSKVKYNLGGKAVSGKMNIEHGKRLCMTAQIMGIEFARLEMNSDTIFAVNKLDKVYTMMLMSEMAEKFGLSKELKYDAFEAVLMGRIFIPGEGYARDTDFRKLAWEMPADENLQVGYKGAQYELTYTIDEIGVVQQTEVVIPSRDMKYTWNYPNYQPIDDGSMPETAVLKGKVGDRVLTAEINFGAPSLGRGWNPFVPSEMYRKVTLEEFIETIRKHK